MERERTTTIVTRGGPGDPVRGLIRKRLAGFMRMNPEAYCEAYWEAMADNPEAKLVLYKRAAGIASKIAEVDPGEHDPADVETWIMSEWGDGAYQFQPQVAGRMYGPASKVFRFGEVTDEQPRKVEQDTIDHELQAIIRRLGHIASVGKLTEVTRGAEAPKGDGDDMKMTDVAALMQTQMAPLIEMAKQSETRAQRAEERLEKMLDRMMEERRGAAPVNANLFAEVFKTAVGKPEIMSLLLNGTPPPESSWLDTIRDLAREFGPAVQSMIAQVMERQGAAVAALPPSGGGASGPAHAASNIPGGPRPTATPPAGDGTMPMPLNEEQQMAKDNLVEFIKMGDFDNAFAALEAFPGLMPVQNGAVPLGEFIISKIDPKVNARVYLPQLAMLIPEFKAIQPQALAFVQAIQRRILADDESARRADGSGAEGSLTDMRPTTRGEDA